MYSAGPSAASQQARQTYNIQNQQAVVRNEGSFVPSNLSIKRPRADEDDYDI